MEQFQIRGSLHHKHAISHLDIRSVSDIPARSGYHGSCAAPAKKSQALKMRVGEECSWAGVAFQQQLALCLQRQSGEVNDHSKSAICCGRTIAIETGTTAIAEWNRSLALSGCDRSSRMKQRSCDRCHIWKKALVPVHASIEPLQQ